VPLVPSGGKPAPILHEGILGISDKSAAAEKRVGLVAMGAAQEHEFGAIPGDCQLLHMGKKLPSNAPATIRTCYHDVFNDAEGLELVHDIRTDGQKCGGTNGSFSLGNQKEAGRGFGEGRNLLGKNADGGVVDQFAIDGLDGSRVFGGSPPDHAR
jgi:hypothetical protein